MHVDRARQLAVPARLRQWLAHHAQDGTNRPRGEAFALGTTVGSVRTENQDRTVLARFSFHGSSAYLAILSDGMGGMVAGRECAELATAHLLAFALTERRDSASALLRGAMQAANTAVYSVHRGRGGAACAAVLIHGLTVSGINAGDARVYLVRRDGAPDQLSSDDTLAARVAALRPQAELSDTRTELLQFVGIGADLEPHLFERQLTDDIRGTLITSDGAHGVPGVNFRRALDESSAVRALVDNLLATSLRLGGRDNASVIAISTRDLPTATSQGVIEVWTPSASLEIWHDIDAETRTHTTYDSTEASPKHGPPTKHEQDLPSPTKRRRPRKRRGRQGQDAQHTLETGTPIDTPVKEGTTNGIVDQASKPAHPLAIATEVKITPGSSQASPETVVAEEEKTSTVANPSKPVTGPLVVSREVQITPGPGALSPSAPDTSPDTRHPGGDNGSSTPKEETKSDSFHEDTKHSNS